MKKLNAKGFTLIELLAVITIMGILMLVAIPTVGRTIENTRKDTFLDTAKQYANGVKTMWLSDSLECGMDSNYVASSALNDGNYLVRINSALASGATDAFTIGGSSINFKIPTILESGGKSSWSNLDVNGFVLVNVSGSKTTYSVFIKDTKNHGIEMNDDDYLTLTRAKVVTVASEYAVPEGMTINGICQER